MPSSRAVVGRFGTSDDHARHCPSRPRATERRRAPARCRLRRFDARACFDPNPPRALPAPSPGCPLPDPSLPPRCRRPYPSHQSSRRERFHVVRARPRPRAAHPRAPRERASPPRAWTPNGTNARPGTSQSASRRPVGSSDGAQPWDVPRPLPPTTNTSPPRDGKTPNWTNPNAPRRRVVSTMTRRVARRARARGGRRHPPPHVGPVANPRPSWTPPIAVCRRRRRARRQTRRGGLPGPAPDGHHAIHGIAR